MTAEFKLSLPMLTLDTAGTKGKAVLDRAKAQVGFIHNMYAGMVNSPGLLETYLDGYERFRKASGLTPAEQEVVFLVVSRGNDCDYCVAAHSMIADKMSGVPVEVTDAIREGRQVPDAKLAALATFAETMRASRGKPSNADVSAFLAAGYEERHVLEIILAIATKTISNYFNHVFHTPLDDMFAGRSWKHAA